MKRIYNKEILSKIKEEIHLEEYFDTKNIDFFVCQYDKGEFLGQPNIDNEYLQLIIDGTVSIYFIHDDGSKYSVAQSEGITLLGDIEFNIENPATFFVEALTDTTTINISLTKYRDLLHNDNRFLNFALKSLSKKLVLASTMDCMHLSLSDRVLNHMKYHCENHILKGIEKTAFRLHCSDRQLQRILNQFETQHIVEKRGKGTYELL